MIFPEKILNVFVFVLIMTQYTLQYYIPFFFQLLYNKFLAAIVVVIVR
jgi:hypothetical protein